jgi:putative endonuclease
MIGSPERPSAALGRRGEEAALARYARLGYTVVARNWHCALGELDLVVARDGQLVVCEVKARRDDAFGGPYDAVTWRKRRKLKALAEAFIASNRLRPEAVRFDVASVTAGTGGRMSVHVFEDAF